MRGGGARGGGSRPAAFQDLRRPSLPAGEGPARARAAINLCHIVPRREERSGGPSKSGRAGAGARAGAGHEVDLLTTAPGEGGIRTDGRLTRRTFTRDWPGRICRSAGLRAHLGRTDPDIIHHHSIWLRTLHYAHRSAARRGVPLVVSPRGMMSEWAWGHRRSRKRLACRLIHPGALAAVSGWHATSEEEAADIRARGFPQPICVAPNGVGAPQPEACAEAARHWNECCPAAALRPVALFYSRFHRKKRVLELIDVWLEHGPRDWLLLLVGIPEEYTPESLEEYVARFGGAGKVEVFSGAGHPPPYAAASLFLLPSHSENFGLVVAEAMAHGLPVLVTDTTPWRVLGPEGIGWCVPWDEFPAALRTATAEAPELLRERGGRARDWVLREYSWERPIRALEEFYRQLRT